MKKVFIPLLVIFLLLTGLLLYKLWPRKTSPTVSPLISTSTINNTSGFVIPTAPVGEYNLLLLGNGGAGHSGGILTDSMMIVHLNTATKSAALIFIPRDLWVNGTKINEAYSRGGLAEAKKTVSYVSGLPIQYAVVIDFPAFVQLVDSLGGITVNVPKTFDDYYYPIEGKELDICNKSADEVAQLSATMSGFQLESQFTCRYEHLHFDQGITQMDGTTALKFARSRHSLQDGTDFARGSRQQAILLGIKDKLLSLNVFNNVNKLFNNFSKLVKTDLDLPTVKAVAEIIINPKEYKISQVVPSTENVLTSGTSSTSQSILLPKAGDGHWQDFQSFIKKGL